QTCAFPTSAGGLGVAEDGGRLFERHSVLGAVDRSLPRVPLEHSSVYTKLAGAGGGGRAVGHTVVLLIGKVEAALNDIWNVRRARGLPRMFSDYLSVLLVGPVLVFAAFGIIASLRSSAPVQRLLQITRLEAATVFVAGHVVPLLLLGAAFTFLYRFLPY